MCSARSVWRNGNLIWKRQAANLPPGSDVAVLAAHQPAALYCFVLPLFPIVVASIAAADDEAVVDAFSLQTLK